MRQRQRAAFQAGGDRPAGHAPVRPPLTPDSYDRAGIPWITAKVSGHGATPVGGENGGRHTVRLRGGRAGSVTQERLVPIPASYQSVMPARKGFAIHPLCCTTVGTPVEGSGR